MAAEFTKNAIKMRKEHTLISPQAQGNLTEGEGSVQLTSLRSVAL